MELHQQEADVIEAAWMILDGLAADAGDERRSVLDVASVALLAVLDALEGGPEAEGKADVG